MQKDELIKKLNNLGFTSYRPRTTSWQQALISSNNTSTIYFLIGNHSIDFKYYDHIRTIKTDDKGHLSTDGGKMVRNYYSKSTVDIHQHIFDIATMFNTNLPIADELLTDHGITWADQKREYARKHSSNSKLEMIELYHEFSVVDGEDAYLGDGIWISSDGKLNDRGR